MGFRVEPYQGERDPRSTTMSRSRGGDGELGEMQELFEQMMAGEDVDLEEIDWEEMWNSVMEEEGSYEEGEQQQGSQYPTMFGSPIRPSGVKYPTSPGVNFY